MVQALARRRESTRMLASWPAQLRWPTGFSLGTREEIADDVCDFVRMRFEGEVPSIEEANDCARIVPLERLRARRQEERIVLAPHSQKRRFVSAEVLVE